MSLAPWFCPWHPIAMCSIADVMVSACSVYDDQYLEGLHPAWCPFKDGRSCQSGVIPRYQTSPDNPPEMIPGGAGKGRTYRTVLIHFVWNDLLQVQWPSVKTKSIKVLIKDLIYASYYVSSLCTVFMINAFRTREMNHSFEIAATGQQSISVSVPARYGLMYVKN